MLPHTVGPVKRREVKVATLVETAAVVSDAPADVQWGHTALPHVALLALHQVLLVEACPGRPAVFLLLGQELQGLEVTGGDGLHLHGRLAAGLPSHLLVLFVPRGVRGLRGRAAWVGEAKVR